MRTPALLVASMLALFLIDPAGATEPDKSGYSEMPAQSQTERASNAEESLAEMDRSLKAAHGGVYGTIRPSDMQRLENARDSIEALLEGPAGARGLSPEDRVTLHNAEQLFVSILRKDDKSRMVCVRETKTGSRLPGKTECLTLAEREARAASAREGTEAVKRNVCYTDEGQSCE